MWFTICGHALIKTHCLLQVFFQIENRVPGISENCHRDSRIRENRVSTIREIGSQKIKVSWTHRRPSFIKINATRHQREGCEPLTKNIWKLFWCFQAEEILSHGYFHRGTDCNTVFQEVFVRTRMFRKGTKKIKTWFNARPTSVVKSCIANTFFIYLSLYVPDLIHLSFATIPSNFLTLGGILRLFAQFIAWSSSKRFLKV